MIRARLGRGAGGPEEIIPGVHRDFLKHQL